MRKNGEILVYLEIFWFKHSGRFFVPLQTALLFYDYVMKNAKVESTDSFIHSYTVYTASDTIMIVSNFCTKTTRKKFTR